jgi:hypothetical protein
MSHVIIYVSSSSSSAIILLSDAEYFEREVGAMLAASRAGAASVLASSSIAAAAKVQRTAVFDHTWQIGVLQTKSVLHHVVLADRDVQVAAHRLHTMHILNGDVIGADKEIVTPRPNVCCVELERTHVGDNTPTHLHIGQVALQAGQRAMEMGAEVL